MKIKNVHARSVLDSRGNPTVEVEVSTQKVTGRAIVPSGASTGIYEAHELRDKKKAFLGNGVEKAVTNVNTTIAKKLKGMDIFNLSGIDQAMIDLDGTKNKKKLGANAILGTSMAVARAGALEKGISLHKYLGNSMMLPIPFCNIINGGKHAGGDLEMQEFMVAPVKAKSFAEATKIISEIYHILKGIIKKKYGVSAANVGDEGGFAPNIDTAEKALDLIMAAVQKAGYSSKVRIAMDPASSEFYHDGTYLKKKLSRKQMARYYAKLTAKYPIISIEDPFEQDDFESYSMFMKEYQPISKIQVVGDDLLVTNVDRIKIAKEKQLCNALLLKVNQIGSLTEAIAAAKMCMKNKWHVMVSHRSGESEDPFIADLAVGLGTGQIKLGAPCRSDRTSKFNQLLRIEEELGSKAKYPTGMFK
jgi:enolase